MGEKAKVGIIVAVLVGIALAVMFWPSAGAEQEVRKRLDKLAETASVEDFSGSITGAASQAAAATKFFAEDVAFRSRFPELPPVGSRDQLKGAAIAAYQQLKDFRMSFSGVDVEFNDDETTASVTCRVNVSALFRSMNDESDSRRIGMTLEKTDGEWMIAEVVDLE